MKSSLLSLLTVAGMLTSTAVSAEEKRQLDAHEHGAVILNLAIEQQTLFMELRSPAINIIGFEHAPSTDEQTSLIAAETARLQNGTELFVIAGTAGCTLGKTNVALVRDSDQEHDGEDHKEHDDHDEKHADHDEEHADEEQHGDHDEDAAKEEKHGDHDEEHAHAGGESGGHAEFQADYTYQCTDPGALDSIAVNLFSLYPGIEKIVVAGVVPGGQLSQTLSPSSPTIVLP